MGAVSGCACARVEGRAGALARGEAEAVAWGVGVVREQCADEHALQGWRAVEVEAMEAAALAGREWVAARQHGGVGVNM